MRLLLAFDDAIYEKNGKRYTTPQTYTFCLFLSKYFSDIILLANEGEYSKGKVAIDNSIQSEIVKKHDVVNIVKKGREIIKEKKIDIVFSIGINGIIISQFAYRQNIPVIAYMGSYPFDYQLKKGNIKQKIKAIIWYVLFKYQLKKAEYAHFCAQFIADKLGRKKNLLVCSAANVIIDESVLQKRKNFIQMQSTREHVRIGLIGQTHTMNKGVDTALKALSRLPENVFLEVVGGENTTYLKALADSLQISSRVSYKGTLHPNLIMDWLDTVDVYIQPSLSEGLPRATIEAISRGCPVVASNIAGIPELVDLEYLIKPKDDIALSQKIHAIISDKSMAEKIAVRNFERAKKYSEYEKARKFDAFYGSIIKDLEEKEKI